MIGTDTASRVADAERMRDVFMRDVAHVETLLAMAETIKSGLGYVAAFNDVFMARGNISSAINNLHDLKREFEDQAASENQRIAGLRKAVRTA